MVAERRLGDGEVEAAAGPRVLALAEAADDGDADRVGQRLEDAGDVGDGDGAGVRRRRCGSTRRAELDIRPRGGMGFTHV